MKTTGDESGRLLLGLRDCMCVRGVDSGVDSVLSSFVVVLLIYFIYKGKHKQ